MILTNILLSIGFSLVSNFAHTVTIPVDQVPKRSEDLRQYAVGSTFWPVDLDLAHRRGAVFGIQHGAVLWYLSPDSFLRVSDPKLIPQFRGTANLSSNQVLELAELTVRRLAKRGDPIAGLHPYARRLRESSDGPEVPFYEVSWLNTKRDAPSPAYIEIDARYGQIVKVHLLDYAFYDLAFAWEMRKRACVHDPLDLDKPANRPVAVRRLPCPSTNNVLHAINSWLWLCRGLEAKPSSGVDLAKVDWLHTCIYTNPWIAPTAVVCRVTFTNGSWFDAVEDKAFDTFASDACYVNEWSLRTPEDWFLFQGKISHRWEDLARNLEQNLVVKLGVPEKLVAKYGRALGNTKSPELGEIAIKRVLVNWTNGEPQRVDYSNDSAWAWENHLGFAAEFDVETGELKSMRFRDPKLIQALGSEYRNQ